MLFIWRNILIMGKKHKKHHKGEKEPQEELDGKILFSIHFP